MLAFVVMLSERGKEGGEGGKEKEEEEEEGGRVMCVKDPDADRWREVIAG